MPRVSIVLALALFVLVAVRPAPGQYPDSVFLSEPCPRGSRILDREFYVICYSPDWKIARWVGYLLTPENLKGTTKRTNNFRSDKALESVQRSLLVDYRGSGYDRGHMAPAAAFKRSKSAMSTTFLLSNMAPQTSRLNRGAWKRLESEVRELAGSGGRTWVFTGNLFLDDDGKPVEPSNRIGGTRVRPGVAVPTHGFKVILHETDDGVKSAFGFLFPNQRGRIPGPSASYVRSVDEIEALAGTNFFTFLGKPEQDLLERSTEAPSAFD